jgi:hypothetical protein
MNNRAINKALAEFLGWKELDFHLDGKRILGDRPTFSNGKVISYTVDQYVPDYCNDLNLMHEAEKLLDDDQWLEYMLNLQDVLQRDPHRGKWVVCQDNMHSTAAQRAKAFVKTIDKWKE